MAKKSKAQSANANKANKANANEVQNVLAIEKAFAVVESEELTEEQNEIAEVVSEINNALGITPNEAQAPAQAEAPAPAQAPAQAQAPAPAQAPAQAQAPANEMTEEQKNAIICNTTKNQLEECAKRVQKEVNSLNGALKALYNEKIFQDLFNALGLESYDQIRLSVMQSIAYASEDNEGKFIAVTLKPVARFNATTYYKVQKLNWFTAIAQSTYRLARGLARVQNVIVDSYYIKQENADVWQEVEDSATIAEIDKQIKADKYTKALARVNKLKLEF